MDTDRSPATDRVHRLLLAEGAWVEIRALSALTGLHHTTLRQHLGRLEALGLVEVRPVPRTGRGRPRLSYRALPREDEPYRFLSSTLVEAVREGLDAREAGRRSGARAAAAWDTAGLDAGARVVGALEHEARRLGFDPEVRDAGTSAEVVLRHCPFAALAAHDPDVVCDVHLGLAEGIANALGGQQGVRVTGLRVGSTTDSIGCALQVSIESPSPGEVEATS